MDGPATTGARLQAPTGPHMPVVPRRGGAAPSRVLLHPTPSQQFFRPGITARKNPQRPRGARLLIRAPPAGLPLIQAVNFRPRRRSSDRRVRSRRNLGHAPPPKKHPILDHLF
ncbi:hypothetical protein NDU88_002919 [Pleurodeles waltl]|uniref:Uncharacterized protein n=1 Tax=Pleurodeles waltl TaxID=8319 RepID=A0AAV7PD53_PLEWA|nr:hypothetical protein NDU88_002919 [Pleurodeles waltl]